MTIASGIRSGVRSGIRSGLNPSLVDGDPFAGVTTDATLGWRLPSSAAEWTTFRSAAGLSIANPGHLRLCQDAAGDATDEIGGVALTAAGTPHYLQAVAGATRKALTLDAGASGDKFMSASIPSPYVTSVVQLVVVNLPATPGANSVICGPHPNGSATGGLYLAHASANGSIFVRNNGQIATGIVSHSSGIRLLILKYDRTNSLCKVYTNLETISPTYQALTGTFTSGGLGTNAGAVSGCGFLYEADWSGADAEAFTDAQAAALIAAITGS